MLLLIVFDFSWFTCIVINFICKRLMMYINRLKPPIYLLYIKNETFVGVIIEYINHQIIDSNFFWLIIVIEKSILSCNLPKSLVNAVTGIFLLSSQSTSYRNAQKSCDKDDWILRSWFTPDTDEDINDSPTESYIFLTDDFDA